MDYLFTPPPVVALAIAGSQARFPVRRVYCVGRNYADHAREMGAVDQAEGREPPFFFSKPADALVPGGVATVDVLYPPQTAKLQHEVELVVAIGRGGANIPVTEALDCVFGYTVGFDLTRRDLQAEAKALRRPWDMSKGFDGSAVVGPIRRFDGRLPQGHIRCTLDGRVTQEGLLADMIWNVPALLAHLSRFVTLCPGDLVFTGTPEGVGAVQRGDLLEGGIEGLGSLRVQID